MEMCRENLIYAWILFHPKKLSFKYAGEALFLQRLSHAAKGNALNDHELVNTILAALAAETTLLDTTKPTFLSVNDQFRTKEERLTVKQRH